MVAIAERSRTLEYQKAEEHLYQIWYGYENIKQKTKGDTSARSAMIAQLERGLTEGARRYFDEKVSVDIGDEVFVVERRQEIRWRAVNDVRLQREEERILRAEEERRSKPSVGERRAIRRKKAAEKGTDPNSIH